MRQPGSDQIPLHGPDRTRPDKVRGLVGDKVWNLDIIKLNKLACVHAHTCIHGNLPYVQFAHGRRRCLAVAYVSLAVFRYTYAESCLLIVNIANKYVYYRPVLPTGLLRWSHSQSTARLRPTYTMHVHLLCIRTTVCLGWCFSVAMSFSR